LPPQIKVSGLRLSTRNASLLKAGDNKLARLRSAGDMGILERFWAPLTLIAGGRLKLPTEGRKVQPSAQVMCSMLIGLALTPGTKQLI
jgi:hypothetical protein